MTQKTKRFTSELRAMLIALMVLAATILIAVTISVIVNSFLVGFTITAGLGSIAAIYFDRQLRRSTSN